MTGKLAYHLISNPPPGSKLAEAKEFGIDLTLLLEGLDLTPTERAKRLSTARRYFEKLRKALETSGSGK